MSEEESKEKQAKGLMQASITKKGKELIDKLRGMEDE